MKGGRFYEGINRFVVKSASYDERNIIERLVDLHLRSHSFMFNGWFTARMKFVLGEYPEPLSLPEGYGKQDELPTWLRGGFSETTIVLTTPVEQPATERTTTTSYIRQTFTNVYHLLFQ